MSQTELLWLAASEKGQSLGKCHFGPKGFFSEKDLSELVFLKQPFVWPTYPFIFGFYVANMFHVHISRVVVPNMLVYLCTQWFVFLKVSVLKPAPRCKFHTLKVAALFGKTLIRSLPFVALVFQRVFVPPLYRLHTHFNKNTHLLWSMNQRKNWGAPISFKKCMHIFMTNKNPGDRSKNWGNMWNEEEDTVSWNPKFVSELQRVVFWRFLLAAQIKNAKSVAEH